ncbi:unnamed protein product [Cyprideis torosa]|uniref:ER lumen protein-retaining receptor n=1 Tax=Cyprideis torosa TaxID=163714 RepID=A0A7R8W8X5_9CRUS|nr:unnamed protein product [Cyprideis torosa]CAG0886704.1 unnamed protein product [Cyprideis torosa]
MNPFRLGGDLSHLLAIIILLLKIWKSRSCAGISGKSQILFAVTYTARYLDLVTNFVSVYNTTMKIFFMAASYGTLYLMYMKFKDTYDQTHDTFRIEFLVLPVASLAFLVNHEFSVLEILWTFSIYLEAVAILPQLFMVSKTGKAESITSHYLFALGSYRALYILNWIFRYYMENFFDPIAVVAGIVQTVLYCDFFYLYITKGISGKSQILFALTYTARYLDLLTNFVSVYNTTMKIFFLAASYGTLYLMYMKFKVTYDQNHDTFRIEFLVLPVAALAFLVNHEFAALEILWTFSIYLEAVAILPQLFMVSKTGEAESITSHYLFALGSYRALYILNWIYRYYMENFFDPIAVVAGIVQTILYCDFFYLYITKVLKGKNLTLPV